MELAELLQWLSGALKTGTLAVDNGKVKKEIVFRDGKVISSASTDPRDHLGAFLMSHGFISETELTQAVEMQRSNKMLLGKILLTIGAIGESDLQRMLRLKAEESIYDVFTWNEGDFRFLDGQLPPSETMVAMSLDVAAVVLEGMQRLDEWRRIEKILPSLDAVPVRLGAFDESGASELDSKVLSLVDDDRSVHEICGLAHAPEFRVCRVLTRQYLAGRLKLIRPRDAPAARDAAGAPSSFSSQALIERSRELLAKDELEGALRHARAAHALDPENRQLTTECAKTEEAIRISLERAGLRSTDVPELARPLEELAQQRLSPQEGFLLSRLDGRQPLGSLLKMGPLPPLDMQLVLWRLLRQGHIRMRGKA